MEAINTVGRRKAAIARVYLSKGKGNITINNKNFKDYFSVNFLQTKVEEPLLALEVRNDYDVTVNVTGGGIKGQAEAVRLGIARAFVEMNPELKPALKAQKLLTRDPRVVERKKPGKKKARKSFQFSKR